jgi:hypothetical protein
MDASQLDCYQLLQDGQQPTWSGRPESSLLCVALDRGAHFELLCWHLVALPDQWYGPVPSLHQRLQLWKQQARWRHEEAVHKDEPSCCQRQSLDISSICPCVYLRQYGFLTHFGGVKLRLSLYALYLSPHAVIHTPSSVMLSIHNFRRN